MRQTTKLKPSRKRKAPPPVLAREYLESLGYRVTEDGIENEEQQLKILAVEREHDGSRADFCFVSNMAVTAGLIAPYPLSFYREQMELED